MKLSCARKGKAAFSQGDDRHTDAVVSQEDGRRQSGRKTKQTNKNVSPGIQKCEIKIGQVSALDELKAEQKRGQFLS